MATWSRVWSSPTSAPPRWPWPPTGSSVASRRPPHDPAVGAAHEDLRRRRRPADDRRAVAPPVYPRLHDEPDAHAEGGRPRLPLLRPGGDRRRRGAPDLVRGAVG